MEARCRTAITGIREAIDRLRSAGRSNPFLRCLLLVFAWIAFSTAYVIPLYVLFSIVFGSENGRLEGSLVFISGIIAQFLGALTAVSLLRRYLDRQSIQALGLELRPGWVRDLVWGTALGFALMVLSVGIVAVFGWVDFAGSGWGWRSVPSIIAWTVGGVISLIMVAFYEELIARGYLLQNLAAGSDLARGVMISSVLFGAAHLMNPSSSPLAALNTALAGLLFALIYLCTGSLWAPIGVHFGWNLTQDYILGLPVSGFDFFARQSPLLLKENGPDIVTGGAFGPEGGLVVTAVLAAVCLYFFLKIRAATRPH